MLIPVLLERYAKSPLHYAKIPFHFCQFAIFTIERMVEPGIYASF